MADPSGVPSERSESRGTQLESIGVHAIRLHSPLRHNTFYIGHTEDLASREALPDSGAGANYTALRRPVVLAYSEFFAS
jgi:hypothetical protein